MAKEISTEVRGETVTFFPQKAAFWNRRKTLILADLHWGKSEVFQKNGIPIPNTVLASDLAQLSELMTHTGTERVVVLGDLLHSAKILDSELIDTIAAWREKCPQTIVSIRGNHDPKVGRLPESWRIEWIDNCLVEDPFCFRHEPEASDKFFTWCGHIHPVVHLGHARDRMRLPCFWISQKLGILPSFGFFTGGFPIEPAKQDSIYVVAEQEIFSMS
jgi:DNA ligase-associated metallophosphoesterase